MPTASARLATMAAADSGTNRRDQNRRPGPDSNTALVRGTAQARNAGYMAYAHNSAMMLPSTPPNPSSRSGLASTINRLPNPSDAQTMDQNDAGSVMRHASAASAPA